MKIHYIILEKKLVLSKKDYNNWREIQDDYYDDYKSSLGPWTKNELIDYFKLDYKDEKDWPFSEKTINDFFNSKSEKLIIYEL